MAGPAGSSHSALWIARLAGPARGGSRANGQRGTPAPRAPRAHLAFQAALLFGPLAAAALAGPGQMAHLEDPVRFWRHESGYAGSRSCEACHQEIYALQNASNHARSLRQAGFVWELADALPFQRFDRVSGFDLLLSGDAAGRIRLEASNGAESSGADLAWAFGSGRKGITPVGRTDAGGWVESRLTWYESIGGIDFTTGASKYDPGDAVESLGRALTAKQVAECFSCHTTGSAAAAPGAGESGIRCERCHGPGRAHVEAAAGGRPLAGTIFSPGELAGFQQVRMCGACHGVPPQDNDFDALALLERTPHSVRFPSQRIVLSRCFNETFGELACTSCHDPHQDVPRETHSFDASCLSCHDSAARERAAVCAVAARDCASCHMPRERVMRHSLFSDHWIRVTRQQ